MIGGEESADGRPRDCFAPAVGDKVFGRFGDAWYAAVVEKKLGLKYVVAWEDGDTRNRVKTLRQLRPLHPREAPALAQAPAPAPAPGSDGGGEEPRVLSANVHMLPDGRVLGPFALIGVQEHRKILFVESVYNGTAVVREFWQEAEVRREIETAPGCAKNSALKAEILRGVQEAGLGHNDWILRVHREKRSMSMEELTEALIVPDVDLRFSQTGKAASDDFVCRFAYDQTLWSKRFAIEEKKISRRWRRLKHWSLISSEWSTAYQSLLLHFCQSFPATEGDHGSAVNTLRPLATEFTQKENHARIHCNSSANQTAIDRASAPVFGIDERGMVNEWNNKVVEMTGFSKDEVLGRDLVQDFIPVEFRESVKEVLGKALLGEEAAYFEFPLFTKDQARVELFVNATTRRNVSGKAVGVLGIGKDLTEWKRVKAQMQQQLQLLAQQELEEQIQQQPQHEQPQQQQQQQNHHCPKLEMEDVGAQGGSGGGEGGMKCDNRPGLSMRDSPSGTMLAQDGEWVPGGGEMKQELPWMMGEKGTEGWREGAALLCERPGAAAVRGKLRA